MTTVRVLVLVLVAIALGAVIRPVHGQTEAAPVHVGQRLTLSYGERTIDCSIAEARGAFVRCEAKPPSAFSRSLAYVTWYNLATVEYVTIRETER
jgi:hypothetical protein